MSKSYKVVSMPEKGGKGVIATKSLKADEVIFIEDILHTQPVKFHPTVEDHAECKALLNELQRLEITPHSDPSLAQKAMDRLKALNATAYLLESPNLKEIWGLEDAHRDARVGERVMVDGLKSEAGQKLNKRRGTVQNVDETDPHRLGVAIDHKANASPLIKSIKRTNLKTLGGIFRTNGYKGVDNTAILAKDLCRINHACGKHANVRKQDLATGKVAIYAQRNIKEGEELLLDYLYGEEKDQDRPKLLKDNFNFECQCPMHK